MQTTSTSAIIRPIELKDNPHISLIIRQVLISFNAAKPGTAFTDDCIHCMYETFSLSDSSYFIAEYNGIVIGGGGIYATPGLPDGYCELVKLYLIKDFHGLGIGKKLINTCLRFAELTGYSRVYLETLPELSNAIPLYEKMGFQYLKDPLGKTGHFNCQIWMEKELN